MQMEVIQIHCGLDFMTKYNEVGMLEFYEYLLERLKNT